MKKTITLEAIDPIELYGVGNKILTEFCSYFPHLKVVARGNELILEGRESDIAEFQVRFGELVERRHRKMNLTVYDVEDIFDGTSSPDKFRLTGDAVIVHGTDGKPIRTGRMESPSAPATRRRRNWSRLISITTSCSRWVPPARERLTLPSPWPSGR